MEKVNTIFKWHDGAFDIVYTKNQTAYRVNEKHIICMFEDLNILEIQQITYETEDAVIIDELNKDNEKIKSLPIFIELEHVYGIDISNPAVINFAKYLVELRDKE